MATRPPDAEEARRRVAVPSFISQVGLLGNCVFVDLWVLIGERRWTAHNVCFNPSFRLDLGVLWGQPGVTSRSWLAGHNGWCMLHELFPRCGGHDSATKSVVILDPSLRHSCATADSVWLEEDHWRRFLPVRMCCCLQIRDDPAFSLSGLRCLPHPNL
ncbi:hypothetical protein VTI74DRAFT_8139 [Chaetomium olivicolor]